MSENDEKSTLPLESPTVKYIITKKFGVTELTKNADGFWQDSEATLYGYADGVSTDAVSACGVAPFDLPNWPYFRPINEACGPHDVMYTDPVFQAFNLRSTADKYLEALQSIIGHPIFGEIFEIIARELGAPDWENPATND